jgi:hypothetical protein
MCEETPNMREEFIPRSRLQDIHFFPNRILLPKAALILSLASRESFAPSTRPTRARAGQYHNGDVQD